MIRWIKSEKGSALIIAVMVMVILTVLGMAFMLSATTEQKISVNYRDSTQIIYVAEAGAGIAEKWFNNPDVWDGTNGNPFYPDYDPTTAVVEMGNAGSDINKLAEGAGNVYLYNKDSSGNPLREIDYDWDGVAEDYSEHNMGAYTGPSSRPFQEPYTSGAAPANVFWGTEDHPDIVASQDYLDHLNEVFNTADSNFEGMEIVDLRVYGPPVDLATKTRHGICTVKCTAAKILEGQHGPYRASQRHVEIVLTPFSVITNLAAISGKAGINANGAQAVHWGTEQSEGDIDHNNNAGNFNNDNTGYARGMFYNHVTAPWQPQTWDMLSMEFYCGTQAGGSHEIEDPWFMIKCEGLFKDADSFGAEFSDVTAVDNYHPLWKPITEGTGDPASQTVNYFGNDNDAGPDWSGHTNIFQNVDVNLPDWDYDTWKNLVLAGLQSDSSDNFHFFDWDGSQYVERGTGLTGTVDSFFGGTYSAKGGIYFFDTTDGNEPNDPDGDGNLSDSTNLTPAVNFAGGGQIKGLAYMCITSIKFVGNAGVNAGYIVPGEDYADGVSFIFYPAYDGVVGGASWWYNNADIDGVGFDTNGTNGRQNLNSPYGGGNWFDLNDPRDIIWDTQTATTTDPDQKLQPFRKANKTWDFIDWSASLAAGAVQVTSDPVAPGQLLDESLLVFGGINDAGKFDPREDPHEPFVNFDYDAMTSVFDNVSVDYGTSGGKYGVPDAGHDGGKTISADCRIYGAVYIAGEYDAAGTAIAFGSVTADAVATMKGTTDIFFDQRLLDGLPFEDYGIPKVIRAQKQTDM